MVALAPLALCGVLVAKTWDENYGNRDGRLRSLLTTRDKSDSVVTTVLFTLKFILLKVSEIFVTYKIGWVEKEIQGAE